MILVDLTDKVDCYVLIDPNILRFQLQRKQNILKVLYLRCSICGMNMGSNSGYFAGQSHMMPSSGKDGASNNPGKKITPFGQFFSWCQTCRHGGHCDHLEGIYFTHSFQN